MQKEYFNYLTKIIESQKGIGKAKKNILYILLTHWFDTKNSLSISELQAYLNKTSVVYNHIDGLRKRDLIICTPSGHGFLEIKINIDGIEELGRQQREKENLKNKISHLIE